MKAVAVPEAESRVTMLSVLRALGFYQFNQVSLFADGQPFICSPSSLPDSPTLHRVSLAALLVALYYHDDRQSFTMLNTLCHIIQLEQH